MFVSGIAQRSSLVLLKAILIVIALSISSPASANSFFSQFKDPKDGALDLSNWLVDRRGVLPVPLFISDPAVGYGGGAALLFFHKSAQDKEKETIPGEDDMLELPPSISAVAGAYTENESWILAGGHFGSSKDDTVAESGLIKYMRCFVSSDE